MHKHIHFYCWCVKCKCDCDPSQLWWLLRRAGSQRRIYLDALQCSSIKFYRSHFVDSNITISPINCVLFAHIMQPVARCTPLDGRAHKTKNNTNVKIFLSFSASVHTVHTTVDRTDVFSIEREVSVDGRKRWSDKRSEFVSNSIWILLVNVRCFCHG